MAMTESEWLAERSLQKLFDHVLPRAIGSEGGLRKLRLFACAACRRLWHLLRDERSRRAVEIAELFADELAGPDDLQAAAAHAQRAARAAARESRFGWNAASLAASAAGPAPDAARHASWA